MNKNLIFSLIALILASLACSMLTGTAPNPALVASSTASVNSTPPATQPIQPTLQMENPANHASHTQRNVTYCTVSGVDLKMDIYFPKGTTGVTPLVVYIHGGGWSSGDKSGGAGAVDAPALLDAGFTVASLDYRLAPQYKMPAMIEDVKCAIRSFRAHAGQYNIDPNRIGVWGGSAGGHLVSILGTSDKSAGFDVGEYLDQSSRVQAVVDMFGPADFLTFPFSGNSSEIASTVFGTTDLSNPIFAATSPVTYISADDPPFLILQGDADTTVPLSQSQEFYNKLIASGVDAQLIIVKGGTHGLSTPGESPSRSELTQKIVSFFLKKLK